MMENKMETTIGECRDNGKWGDVFVTMEKKMKTTGIIGAL